jgi:hypothetical protein
VVGAVLGLALGILVSATIDVPFAPKSDLCSVRSSGGSRAGLAASGAPSTPEVIFYCRDCAEREFGDD